MHKDWSNMGPGGRRHWEGGKKEWMEEDAVSRGDKRVYGDNTIDSQTNERLRYTDD